MYVDVHSLSLCFVHAHSTSGLRQCASELRRLITRLSHSCRILHSASSRATQGMSERSAEETLTGKTSHSRNGLIRRIEIRSLVVAFKRIVTVPLVWTVSIVYGPSDRGSRELGL